MRKSGLSWLFLLLLVKATTAAGSEGVVTISIALQGSQKIDIAKLWLPYPVSDEYQQIEDANVQGNYSSSAVYRGEEGSARYLFADWRGDFADRTLHFSFKVNTRERTQKNLVDSNEPVPADIKQYLAATPLIPTDGEVLEMAQQITNGRQGILEKSRAIYDWMVVNTKRDPTVKGCGLGIVERTLAKRSGKCADLSTVYVALARAAGVPAREVFGLRLGNKAKQDITGGYHCWAEFYLPGTGWVQVDPSDVRKIMLTKGISLEEATPYREYYFGSVDEDRIALKKGGRGIQLNPPQNAGPVNYLMYPYAEINGQALDHFNPKDFGYSVSYRVL
jgi:hypothetical protein